MLSNNSNKFEKSDNDPFFTYLSYLKNQYLKWREDKLHIYRNLDGIINTTKMMFFWIFSNPYYLLGVLIHFPLNISLIQVGYYSHILIILTIIWPIITLIGFSILNMYSWLQFDGISEINTIFLFYYFSFIVLFTSVLFFIIEIKKLNRTTLHIQFKISLVTAQIFSGLTYLYFELNQLNFFNINLFLSLLLNFFCFLLLVPILFVFTPYSETWGINYFIFLSLFILYSLGSGITFTLISNIYKRTINENPTDQTGEENHRSHFLSNLQVTMSTVIFSISQFLLSIFSNLIELFKSKQVDVQEIEDMPKDDRSNNQNLNTQTIQLIATDQVPRKTKMHYVVDGSNICWENRMEDEGPEVGRLPRLCLQLKEKYDVEMDQITIYVSAAFRHQIKSKEDKEIFKILMGNKTIKQAPAHEDDDIFIIQHALNLNNSKIISNDLFRDNYSNYHGLEDYVRQNRVSISWDELNKIFIFGSNI